jgi:hypothetical protein
MLDLESMLLIWVCSAAFLPLVVWIRRRSPKWVGLAVMALWVGGSTALGLYAVKHRPVLIPRSEITTGQRSTIPTATSPLRPASPATQTRIAPGTDPTTGP